MRVYKHSDSRPHAHRGLNVIDGNELATSISYPDDRCPPQLTHQQQKTSDRQSEEDDSQRKYLAELVTRYGRPTILDPSRHSPLRWIPLEKLLLAVTSDLPRFVLYISVRGM